MMFLRSLLFMASLILMTPPFIVVLLLLAWLPKRLLRRLSMIWVDTAIWLIRHLLGIDHRVIGAENIPQRSCVILSKHQSAWETIVLQRIFEWTSFVYKRELHWLPFFGWGLALMVGLLVGGQALAVATGLASGAIEPAGWPWVLVVASLVAYTLTLAAIGVAGLLLLRDRFRRDKKGGPVLADL